MANKRIPITLVSGWKRSGKTTIIKHILQNVGSESSSRIAAIVNDSDAESQQLNPPPAHWTVLPSGVSVEQLDAIMTNLIASADTYDSIIIEASSTTEPKLIAELFESQQYNDGSQHWKQRCYIDSCITVVNAEDFLDSIFSSKRLTSAQSVSYVAQLYLEQIEFSNVLIINKSAAVSQEDLVRIHSLVSILNTSSLIIESADGSVNIEPTHILPSSNEDGDQEQPRFDFEDTSDAAGWMRLLDQGTTFIEQLDTSTITEAGVSCFTYNQRRPFHPQRLYDFLTNRCSFILDDDEGGVESDDTTNNNTNTEKVKLIRVKGYIWLATRHDLSGYWSQAGRICTISDAGIWLAALPSEHMPTDPEALKAFCNDFQGLYGDRRQELVFIGLDVDQATVIAELDSCLVSQEQLDYDQLDDVTDPFTRWPSLDELLGGYSDDDVSSSELTGIPEEDDDDDESEDNSEEEEEEEECRTDWIENILDGASQVQQTMERLHPSSLAVIYWHAGWVDGARALADENFIDGGPSVLELFAPKYPGAAIMKLDVLHPPPNRLFANEKVLSKPEAKRAGAKPVLKSGGKFPCFTVHIPPSLQPMDHISGDDALEKLEEVLKSWDLPEEAYIAPPPPPPEEEPIELVELTNGAVQFKEILTSAREADKAVLLLWTSALPVDGDDDDSSSDEDDPLVTALKDCASENLTVVHCQVSENNKANKILAQGLKVKLPAVDLYKNVQRVGRVQGADQVTAEAMMELLQSADLVVATGNSTTSTAKGGGEAEFDPPTGKFAKSGMTKIMADGKTTGHFFPKMPCLRCGNPWWSSDDWHAACLRCGWDCERDGYDDESQPLPAYVDTWSRFVAVIKTGKTPVWNGKRIK